MGREYFRINHAAIYLFQGDGYVMFGLNLEADEVYTAQTPGHTNAAWAGVI